MQAFTNFGAEPHWSDNINWNTFGASAKPMGKDLAPSDYGASDLGGYDASYNGGVGSGQNMDTTPPDFGNNGGQDNTPGTDPYGGGNVDNGGVVNPNTINSLANGGSNPFNLSQASVIPALATAYQQWRQSRQYTDMAERYAQQLDPFGSQRGQYQTMLADTYKNPSQFLNDPVYQQELKHGLDSVARTGASKGYMGSGNMATALEDYAHTSDEGFLQNLRSGLMPLTGAQFGPASAASMLQTGLLGRMGSENAALGSLMFPFGASQGGNNSNSGGSNGGSSGIMNTIGNVARIAASFLPFSDRRLKTNIKQIGKLSNGLNVYSYDIFGQPQIGVMADEVKQIIPEAVIRHESGYDMVNYELL